MRNVYKILIKEPKGKRPLGRSRCRWTGKITVDLTEIGCEDVDGINLAHYCDQ
jgi:hypothetical protein